MMDGWIKFILAYLLMVNLCGFCLCAMDKKKAKNGQWRVPERRFFVIAVLGGGPGVLLSMYRFRHKTKHRTFTVGIPAIIISECILILLIIIFTGKWR